MYYVIVSKILELYIFLFRILCLKKNLICVDKDIYVMFYFCVVCMVVDWCVLVFDIEW